MRADLSEEKKTTIFVSTLLALGEGHLSPDVEGYVSFQTLSIMMETALDRWQAVFGNLVLNYRNLD